MSIYASNVTNNFGYVNFGSQNTRTNTVSNSVYSPIVTPKTQRNYDELILNNQVKQPQNIKKKLIWGAGSTIAVLAGLGIWFATKGKVNKNIFKLAEHIDFKKATTLKEAKEFARVNLGIKKFDIDDLEIVNFLNEGFVNASNTSKGKIVLPTHVKRDLSQELMSVCGLNSGKRVLKVGQLACDKEAIYKRICDRPSIIINGVEYKDMRKASEKIEELTKNSSFEQKMYQMTALLEMDKFSHIYHELGHLNHAHQNYALFRKFYIGTGHDIKKLLQKSKQGTLSKEESRKYQILIEHLSEATKAMEKSGKCYKSIISHNDYGFYYPTEFVAEVYAAKMMGKEIPEACIELYTKYGGPKIGVI